jgi:hypothetical protein
MSQTQTEGSIFPLLLSCYPQQCNRSYRNVLSKPEYDFKPHQRQSILGPLCHSFLSREMVKWRRYINHNKQKQLWDLTFVTLPDIIRSPVATTQRTLSRRPLKTFVQSPPRMFQTRNVVSRDPDTAAVSFTSVKQRTMLVWP